MDRYSFTNARANKIIITSTLLFMLINITGCITKEKDDEELPSPPLNLTAIGEDSKVILNWDPPTDDGDLNIINYSIYRNGVFHSKTGPQTFYVDLDVINGQIYSYQVATINKVGEGRKSTTVNATPLRNQNNYLIKQPENDDNIEDINIGTDHIEFVGISPDSTMNYSIGDIIVGKNDSGFLRRVIDTQRADRTMTLRTEDVSLSEVIEEGTIEVQEYLLQDGTRALSGPEWTLELSNTIYEHDGIKVEIFGKAKVSIQLSFSAQIDDWSLKYLYFGTETKNEISIGLKASKNITLSKEVLLSSHTLRPIVTMIGSFPVVITPVLDWIVGLNVELEAAVTTSISFVQTVKEGMEFKNDEWNYIKDHSEEIEFTEPVLDLSIEAKVYAIAPRLRLLLYGVVGPSLDFSPYLRLEASQNDDPIWSLFFGMNSVCEMELKIIDRTVLKQKFTLFNIEWLVANASGEDEAPPSAPRNVRASSGDGEVILTWEAPISDGGSDIIDYKIYRDDALLTYVGTDMEYIDEDVENGMVYTYQISALNEFGEGPKSDQVIGAPKKDESISFEPITTISDEMITSVSWSPDGTKVASGSGDSTIKIWDVETGTNLRVLSGHEDWVHSIDWSPDGTMIASGSEDSTIRIWNALTGSERISITGHAQMVLSVDWSPDSSKIASSSTDQTIRVWSASTGAELWNVSLDSDDVNSIKWSGDGTKIATGSFRGIISVWNAATGGDLVSITAHSYEILSIAWSNDDDMIVSGSKDNYIKVWKIETQSIFLKISEEPYNVYCVDWSPDGTMIASGAADDIIKIRDARTGSLLQSLIGHDGIIYALSWSPSGEMIASASGDDTIIIWKRIG